MRNEAMQGYDCPCGGAPLPGELPFDLTLAELHNASTETAAWQAYYAGRWREEDVPLSSVMAGQPDLCREKLERAEATDGADGDDPVVMLAIGERRLAMDGHHRLAVALTRRRETRRARVVYLEGVAPIATIASASDVCIWLRRGAKCPRG